MAIKKSPIQDQFIMAVQNISPPDAPAAEAGPEMHADQA